MVWVQIFELRGKNIIWKQYKNASAARAEERSWNQFKNPYDWIRIMQIVKNRPNKLRRTSTPGIFKGGDR